MSQNANVCTIRTNARHEPTIIEDRSQFEDSDQEYKKLLEDRPECSELLVEYGDMLRRAGKEGDAEVQYLKAINLDPGNFGAHFSYATMLEEQKRLDEAEEEYVSSVCERHR